MKAKIQILIIFLTLVVGGRAFGEQEVMNCKSGQKQNIEDKTMTGTLCNRGLVETFIPDNCNSNEKSYFGTCKSIFINKMAETPKVRNDEPSPTAPLPLVYEGPPKARTPVGDNPQLPESYSTEKCEVQTESSDPSSATWMTYKCDTQPLWLTGTPGKIALVGVQFDKSPTYDETKTELSNLKINKPVLTSGVLSGSGIGGATGKSLDCILAKATIASPPRVSKEDYSEIQVYHIDGSAPWSCFITDRSKSQIVENTKHLAESRKAKQEAAEVAYNLELQKIADKLKSSQKTNPSAKPLIKSRAK